MNGYRNANLCSFRNGNSSFPCFGTMKIALLLMTTFIVSSPVKGQSEPPNIVFFLIDDLEYGELECQDNFEIPTPHINSIAQNGVLVKTQPCFPDPQIHSRF